MKLSLTLLAEQLNIEGLHATPTCTSFPGPYLKGVRILPAPSAGEKSISSPEDRQYRIRLPLSPDFLYVDLHALLPDYPPEQLRALPLVLPENQSEEQPPPNALLIPEDAVPENVFNQLLAIFERFSEWSERTRQCLLEGRDLNEVLGLCNLVTPDTVWLGDVGMKLHGCSGSEMMHEVSAIWRYQTKYGYIPLDVAYKLNKSSEMQPLRKSRQAFAYDTQAFNLPYTCKNIYDDRELKAHIFVIAIFSRPLQTHKEIAEQLGELLSPYVCSHPGFSKSTGKIYENFFRDLLNGVISGQDLIREQIAVWDWKIMDTYTLGLIDTRGRSDDSTTEYLVDSLCDALPDCKAFTMDEYIVYVFHHGSAKDYSSFLSFFERSCAKMGSFAAISMNFTGIDEANIYFRQVKNILFFGKQHDSLSHVYLQENFGIYSILDACLENHHVYEFCHPDILSLQLADRENQTEYLETLYQYLLNECNALKAANSLYIHRNTMNYRLANIRDSLHIDIEKPLNRLYLLLSILLLKQSSQPKAAPPQPGTENSSQADHAG
ncbi:MAG: helix-turn-helix domain-containing protein [Lachnospiraceae bacterium]|nr:helix-turn-helix domain-containing protein [Lachnospiraceae bacterium]